MRAVQAAHPGMSFEAAWDLVEAEALPYLRKNETVGMALIGLASKSLSYQLLISRSGLPTSKASKERKAHVEAMKERRRSSGRQGSGCLSAARKRFSSIDAEASTELRVQNRTGTLPRLKCHSRSGG